jgi:glycosyltransferase involved in cell wall biosynthesis
VKSILWVINGAEVFGEKRAVVSLVAGVRAAGWEAQVISLQEGECAHELREAGVPTTCLGLGDSPGMHLARSRLGKVWELAKLQVHQRKIRRRIRQEVRARAPAAVHVLDKNILPAVGWATRKERVPCFWELTAVLGGHYPFNLNQRLHQWLVRRFDLHPLANSRHTAHTLGDARRPAEVMYLGVDERRFDPARRFSVTREGLGIPSDAPVFAIIARVDGSKGQATFLEALATAGGGEEHLLLVGAQKGAEEVGRIAERARVLGMSSRVHLVPQTSEPEGYMALSDVVVNAYPGAEAFGLSVVEGMMMGRPLLVHALGGPAETVVDGESGWHVGRATVEAFAAGIRRALADRPRWKEMGAAARRRALERFTLRTQARWYLDQVEKAIRG